MAADLQRVIEAAAQAALDGPDSEAVRRNVRSFGQSSKRRRRRRLFGAGGFLVGAGLVTATRLVVGSRGRELLENLEGRLLEYEERHFGEEYEFDDPDEEEREDDQEETPERSGSASRHSGRPR